MRASRLKAQYRLPGKLGQAYRQRMDLSILHSFN